VQHVPKLDVFVLVTTGPNDANLKRAAAKLNAEQKRRGGFRIEVHGWDWIEGKLKEHVDLAAQYGLIAVIEEVAPRSKVAQQCPASALPLSDAEADWIE
jgi:hypothetical protein